jgi:hypothetical protein
MPTNEIYASVTSRGNGNQPISAKNKGLRAFFAASDVAYII